MRSFPMATQSEHFANVLQFLAKMVVLLVFLSWRDKAKLKTLLQGYKKKWSWLILGHGYLF